jgi:hypothetical protein
MLRSSTPEISEELGNDEPEEVLPAVDKSKLNPMVLPSGAVRRLYVTEESRGATPPVTAMIAFFIKVFHHPGFFRFIRQMN